VKEGFSGARRSILGDSGGKASIKAVPVRDGKGDRDLKEDASKFRCPASLLASLLASLHRTPCSAKMGVSVGQVVVSEKHGRSWWDAAPVNARITPLKKSRQVF